MANAQDKWLVKAQHAAREVWEDRGVGLDAPRVRRFLHFWVMVWRNFLRHRCLVRASALAYTSLLAMVPMLAVVFGITTSFLKTQGQERINAMVQRVVDMVIPPASMSTNLVAPGAAAAAYETEGGLSGLIRKDKVLEARKQVAAWIHEYIQNAYSGTVGITGMILLIFTGIAMLSRVEVTFNDIWGVTRGRTWFWRVVLYWSVISLGPLLLIAALVMATGSHMEATKNLLHTMPLLGRFLFQVLPVLMLGLAFGLFYFLMPNTRVDWRAALVGGLVAGLLLHLNNLISVLYVSRVVTYSKIYGSLGMVPVFMVGLYLSWLILLFGAQVAYAYQNRAVYVQEKQSEQVHELGRELVALRIMTLLAERFEQGLPPATVSELAARLQVPSQLVQRLMAVLLRAQLAVEIAGREPAYAPARPAARITCHEVLLALRTAGGEGARALANDMASDPVSVAFQQICAAEQRAAESVSLADLLTGQTAAQNSNSPTSG